MSLVFLPRQMVVDTAGNPRVGLKVNVYQSGTTTPITTYSDAGFTTPNTNPVVSDANGFLPAIYINPAVNSTYKFTITDANDVLIYSEDNIPALGFTASDVGATLYPRSAGEIAASVTPSDYRYPVGHVHRYGASGDGSTNDLTAVTRAFSVLVQEGGGKIEFAEGRTYNLGTIADASAILIEIEGLENCTIEGNGAELLTNTTVQSSSAIPKIIEITDPNRLVFRNLRFRDTGTDTSVDTRGPRCLSFTASGASDCGDIVLENVVATDMVQLFDTFFTAASTGRVRNISLVNCRATDCYYGIACREQGDYLSAVNFVAENCRRAYFAYGVTGHDVDLKISHDGVSPGANACVLVKRFVFDTKCIKIRASFHGTCTEYGGFVVLETQPTSGTAPALIDDVDIDLHLSDATLEIDTIPVRIRAYNEAGVLQSTTDDRFDRISIRGNFGAWLPSTATNPILIESTQNSEGRLSIGADLFDAFMRQAQQFPGFAVRVGPNKELRTKYGDITASAMTIPLSDYDGEAFALKVRAYMLDSEDATSGQNATYREDMLIGYNASGGGVTLQVTQNLLTVYQGTPETITYAGSDENVTLTFSNYSGAAALARVEVEHLRAFL